MAPKKKGVYSVKGRSFSQVTPKTTSILHTWQYRTENSKMESIVSYTFSYISYKRTSFAVRNNTFIHLSVKLLCSRRTGCLSKITLENRTIKSSFWLWSSSGIVLGSMRIWKKDSKSAVFLIHNHLTTPAVLPLCFKGSSIIEHVLCIRLHSQLGECKSLHVERRWPLGQAHLSLHCISQS